MKKLVPVLTLILCLFAGAALAAKAAPAPGFGGVPFGINLDKRANFYKLKTVGKVDYYVRVDEGFKVDGLDSPTVFYGQSRGKFFAAYVRLSGLASSDEMRKQLVAKYGEPRVENEEGFEVERFKGHGIKIKLKSQKGKAVKLTFTGKNVAKDLAEADASDAALDDLIKTLGERKREIDQQNSRLLNQQPKGPSPDLKIYSF